mmetsp:Transcript_4692/g.8883  ORF Transcript_4692/g.8883 Transcript_4692/m.8883 type:complete len:329 (-) Transcript_4692:187-1173(-)
MAAQSSEAVHQNHAQPEEAETTLTAFRKATQYLVDNDPLRYGCGVDGSLLSMKCFKVCCSLAKKNKGDEIHAVHIIVDPDGPLLKSAAHIRKDYELEATKQAVTMVWHAENKFKSESVCNALMRHVDKLELDFIVLGAYGTTNEVQLDMNKFLADPTMGSVSDELLRTSETSVILAKSTAFELESSRLWVLATDHSESAQTAFALLVHSMAKGTDKVLVLHVGPTQEEELMDTYKRELESSKIPGDVVFLESSGGENVGDMITEFARQKEADFVVMGISGYGVSKLGSVSTHVMRHARCTTVMIKDPREVAGRRLAATEMKFKQSSLG